MRGEYTGEEPERSLKALAATGTEWIALCFAAQMDTKSSPTIRYAEGNDFMVSDQEIHRAIRLARGSLIWRENLPRMRLPLG